MDEKFTRREFLKTGAIVAGAAAAGAVLPKLAAQTHAEPAAAKETGQWVPSCCNMCGGQCGIMVKVVDGKAVKIEPNPYNPNNISCHPEDFAEGMKNGEAVICPKGNAGLATLYDDDRVQKPLKRTNPEKGIGVDPKWKEISWEEAYKEVTDRLKKLRDAGEAHKLLWFTEDHSYTHIQQDFLKLYGSPNMHMHSNLCDTARKASFKVLVGDERPLPDFYKTRFIMFFGWNPLSAIKWSWLARMIPRAIENGARLVVVDPNLSFTATKAHEWVPILPGTDGAMALAMCQTIIAENLVDQEFVKEWTVGFDKLSDYVKDKTPEWAEKITSVPAATIRRLAIEYATTKPAIMDVWSGPGQHSNCVHGGWAIGCLAALTGQFEKPGTLVLPNKKGNAHGKVDAPDMESLKQPRMDGGKKKYPYFHSSGVYTETFNRILDGKGPYQPKIAIINFQNPVMATPGPENVVNALKKLEFIVCFDIFKSETAQLADILIPGATYLERYDLNNHWVLWPVLGLRQPVVKPIFGQPTEAEFIVELGRRLNLTQKDGKDFFWEGHVSHTHQEDKTKWYEEFLSLELIAGEPKISLEDLKKLPGAVWVASGGYGIDKYKSELKPEKLKDSMRENGIIFSTKVGKDGKKEKDAQIGMVKDGKAIKGFMTPSGKVQFYAEEHLKMTSAEGKPVSPLPEYTPRDWQPDATYPLYLVNWKEASHTHTRTQNNAYLLQIKGTNPLRIHTDTAARLGIHDGAVVWVESKFGKVKATVQVTEGIHPQVVGLMHGFGHWELGRNAKGRGTADGSLRPTKSDALSGMALHKECCVKVYPA